MRFSPIVLGWIIATSALSAIASIPGADPESAAAPMVSAG